MAEFKTLANGFEVHEVPWSIYIKQKKNQVFKLLPLMEEDGEWEKQLNTIIVELGGLHSLETTQEFTTITILNKLAGLRVFNNDFDLYRKTVFEVINLLESM